MMGAAGFYKTLVLMYQTAQHHIPEDSNLHITLLACHIGHENLLSKLLFFLSFSTFMCMFQIGKLSNKSRALPLI
jgi:hypothetical protein